MKKFDLNEVRKWTQEVIDAVNMSGERCKGAWIMRLFAADNLRMPMLPS